MVLKMCFVLVLESLVGCLNRIKLILMLSWKGQTELCVLHCLEKMKS